MMRFTRYQDNEEFVALFREKLSNVSFVELETLMSYGQFKATGHWCGECKEDQCDDCYSGDTDFDMRYRLTVLKKIWSECERALQGVEDSNEDAFEDSDESSETAVWSETVELHEEFPEHLRHLAEPAPGRLLWTKSVITTVYERNDWTHELAVYDGNKIMVYSIFTTMSSEYSSIAPTVSRYDHPGDWEADYAESWPST